MNMLNNASAYTYLTDATAWVSTTGATDTTASGNYFVYDHPSYSAYVEQVVHQPVSQASKAPAKLSNMQWLDGRINEIRGCWKNN